MPWMKITETNLWEDDIFKEMKCVIPAFRKLDNGDIVSIGYHGVKCHMIFDVKMEFFSQG